MRFQFQQQDWCNLDVLGKNRGPVRPFYCGFSTEAEAREKKEQESDRYISLNGEWRFSYYTSPFLVPDEVVGDDYDDGKWDFIPVPGHWQLHGYDRPCYNDAFALFPITDRPSIQADNPTGVYRRELRIDKKEGKEYLLRFDGVESAYHVWVNGEFAGYSQGSRNTAEFDVTKLLRNGSNHLAVKVYKYSDGSYLENQDMWWFAGIIRDVGLIVRDEIFVEDFKIESSLHNAYRDGVFRIWARIGCHTGRTEKITAEVSLFDKEKLIFSQEQILEDVQDSAEVSFEKTIEGVRAWSAEDPYLYQTVITLKKDGELTEAYGCRTGFRSVELKNGLFYINGAALKLKGVNRHDWNAYTGRCITDRDMLADLYMMKQNNINAVRTAHYPPSPKFLDMCDELGFYVMEEADLECNQMAYTNKMNRISDAVDWEASYIDRADRMIRRDKNHPSVFSWSLGNESGFGTAFTAEGKFVKDYDRTRLVHYEEDRDASIADVYSTMYTRHHQLEMLGRDTSRSKPHIVCEYAHAMGNGPGGLKEYWEIFEKYPRLQGGFIWEWIDHGLRRKDKNGREYDTYGGDYGDYPNSGAFCCDGLLQADRSPTPALRQVKKVLEPVRFEQFDAQKGTLVVMNKYDFSTLDHLQMIVNVHGRTRKVYKGIWDFPHVGPQQKAQVKVLPDNLVLPDNSEDWWLDISVTYKEAPVWSVSGEHETAFHQELLAEAKKEIREGGGRKRLTVKEENKIVTVTGEDFAAGFDCIHGNLCRYDYAGENLLKDGLGMNFWRAPVDNDKNVREVWENGMLRAVCNVTEEVEVSERETCVEIKVKQFYAPVVLEWKILIEASYIIRQDGRVEATIHGVPVGDQLPGSFPRIGMRFLLDKGCEHVCWYGRGPSETYADCKEGNRIGYYHSTAEQFYFPYVVPQETGNHEDTRWAGFVTKQGNMLLFEAKDRFAFGALHYSQEELTRAAHSNEPERIEDIILCLDYAQHGLGSASWGAECLPKDCLYPEEFTFEWYVCGQRYEE